MNKRTTKVALAAVAITLSTIIAIGLATGMFGSQKQVAQNRSAAEVKKIAEKADKETADAEVKKEDENIKKNLDAQEPTPEISVVPSNDNTEGQAAETPEVNENEAPNVVVEQNNGDTSEIAASELVGARPAGNAQETVKNLTNQGEEKPAEKPVNNTVASNTENSNKQEAAPSDTKENGGKQEVTPSKPKEDKKDNVTPEAPKAEEPKAEEPKEEPKEAPVAPVPPKTEEPKEEKPVTENPTTPAQPTQPVEEPKHEPVVTYEKEYTESKVEEFKTIVVENDDMLISEGEKEISPGVNGEFYEEITIKLVDGKEVSRNSVIKYVVDRKDRVVEVGTKEIVTEDVLSDIDFTTEEEDDINLPQGETKVIPGVKGQLKTTFEIIKVKGLEVLRKEISSETVKEPTPEIVKKGAMVVETKEERGETRVLENNLITIEDESMMVGDKIVQEEGRTGLEVEIFEITLHNGVEVSRKSRIGTELEPVDRVEIVGVREVKKVAMPDKEIPFETIVRESEEKLVSEPNTVLVSGQNGIIGQERIETYIRGELVHSEVIETPKQELIHREEVKGVLEFVTEVETVETEFETEETYVKTLPDGEVNELFAGEKGLDELTHTIKKIRGEEVSRETERRTVSAPKNRRVEIGFIEKTFTEDVTYEEIPVVEIRRPNPDMMKGDSNIVEQGEAGSIKVITVKEFWNDVLHDTKETRETVKEMSPKVVEYGTREILTETVLKPIEITTTYVDNNTLLDGVQETKFDGVEGQIRETITITKVDGREIERTSQEETVKDMQPRMVHVGTKIVSENAESVSRTIKFVDKFGNDIVTPRVDSVSFTKISFRNSDEIIWDEAKTIEAIDIPLELEGKYVLDSNVDTAVTVSHDSEDVTITVKYANKTVQRTVKQSLNVRAITRLSETSFRTLWTLNGIEFDVVETVDLVTDEVVAREDIVVTPEKLQYRFLNSLYTLDRVLYPNNDLRILVPEGQIALVLTEKPFSISAYLDEVMAWPEDVRYQIAKDVDAGKIHGTAKELTQAELDEAYNRLDKAKYQELSLALVNAERALQGKNPLSLAPILDRGTQVRADEQMREGFLRSVDEDGDGLGDKAHYRPDGTRWYTAFNSENGEYPIGENILQNMSYRLEWLISERFHAEKDYYQFKDSPTHYKNMMNERYKGVSFAFRFGALNKLINTEKDGHTSIGVQAFN